MLNQRNSKKQGDVGLGAAISWFCIKGYTVCLPLTDSQDYDLAVDIDNTLHRVQVRTTTSKAASGVFKANLRVSGGNRSGCGKTKHFDPSSVEYLFILTSEGTEYFIPSCSVESKCELYLSSRMDKYIIVKG